MHLAWQLASILGKTNVQALLCYEMFHVLVLVTVRGDALSPACPVGRSLPVVMFDLRV